MILPEPETTPRKGRPICPECGEDLSGRDIQAHTRTHYGEVKPDPRLFPEAAKRHKILTDLAGGGE